MDWQQLVLTLAILIVMGWFAFGVIYNIRLGNQILKWMQGGLPLVGEKTTMRWLGSSVVELNIQKAKSPFRRFMVVVILVPRDVPWLWVWESWRGRKDTIILRGQLNSGPKLEWDLAIPTSWTGRSALSDASHRQWEVEALGDHHFAAPRASRPVSIQQAPGLLESAEKVRSPVWRLGFRREWPQLELHVPLPNLQNTNAREFFQAVRELAIQAGGE